MMTKPKIWLLIAVSLILLGAILFTLVMSANHWDFFKLNTEHYITNTHIPEDAFHSITVATDTADIDFVLSEDGTCKVVCYESDTESHVITVEDDTLMIRLENRKKWYDYIGFSFEQPKVTVYLPKTEYDTLTINEHTGDIEIPGAFTFTSMDITSTTGRVKNYASAADSISIETNTGNIHTENISTGSLSLTVTTGDITATAVQCREDVAVRVNTGDALLTDLVCKNLHSTGSTGDLSLRNVIASGQFFIERDSGDVNFDGCDAAQITVQADTGHVKGSLLSDKIFLAETDTGRVDVPLSTNGGTCRITTDTGNIIISVQ